MSELAMLAQDETKTNADRALYDKEFQKLDDFIVAIGNKDFNGISLFNSSSMSVTVGADGSKMSTSLLAWPGNSLLLLWLLQRLLSPALAPQLL